MAEKVRVPVLILHGMADAVIPARYSKDLANALPNARRVLVENAGHPDLGSFPQTMSEVEAWISNAAAAD